MTRSVWLIALPALMIFGHGALAFAEPPSTNPAAAAFFESKIRPMLVERCFKCHGPESKPEGNLRLDSLAGLLAGGDLGPSIKPGNPKESLLIDAVNHGDVVQMPPKTKLPAEEIANLTAWVAAGAVWPDAPPSASRVVTSGASFQITPEDRNFWAFRAPSDPQLPNVRQADWPQSPVDYFVLAPLEARGLKPAAAANRRTLLRRATFDLHGLPPSPEEVESFLADTSSDAFAKVVDRLLTSPRYGERWGRRWLDLARYADSNGMDENMAMAHAWRYRDYVIGAFNKDLPYDQFVREQLAGDLLTSADPETRFERLIATGFLVLGPKMLAEDDPVKMEMDIIDEQVDTIGRAVLGLTLGCARCHDHKFDPIPTADYYSLAGIFKSTKSMENHKVVAMWSERPLASDDELARVNVLEKQIADKSRDLKHIQAAANDTLLSEARGKFKDYLLAASQLRQQQRTLAQLSKELNAGVPGKETIVIEAEKFVRGNVARDFENYGREIGVIYNAGQLPNFAEYEFTLPAAGTYQLALRYAAAEARPIVLTLDDRLLKSEAAGATTGSWQAETQTWSIEAVVPLASGQHVLRIERAGPIPHLDKLALLPARFTKDPIVGSWLVAGQVPNTNDLRPAFLDQWVRYLERTQDDANSPLRVWHAWQQAEEQGTSPKIDETTSFGAALLKAPRPMTPDELAARYTHLSLTAERAANERSPADRKTPLADPVQEAFRQLLFDTGGPFALPKEPESYYSAETKASLVKLKSELAELEKIRPELPQALAVAERNPQNLRVHIRGSHLTLGAETTRQFPRILAGQVQQPIGEQASGRLELAQWLTRPDHPLTSRVMVNRIWQGHFGEALVRSPDNFGRLGERPDNQPLLDWLAHRFVESGWSIKAMHRLVMLSSAYQMSTTYDALAAQVDPENRLLWRMNRRRLEAEEIRDAILATSGQVDNSMGGTLLKYKNHTYVTSTGSSHNVNYENTRRSVYLPVLRSAVYDVFQAFDFADPSTMNGKRPTTIVAPQALFMMNSSLVLGQTRALAEQLLHPPQSGKESSDDAARVKLVYLRAYSRPPTEPETNRALQFITRYQLDLAQRNVEADELRLRAWQALCRVILSSNEFIYLE